jgi:hypothetical protein
VLLTNYIFKGSENLTELHEDSGRKIFDLTSKKSKTTNFEELEDWYQHWILESKRENTMDEYGQLIGVIDYIQRNQNKKYLLMIVQKAKRFYDSVEEVS